MAQFWTNFAGEDTSHNYILSNNWHTKLVDNRADDGTGNWDNKTTCYFRDDQASGQRVMEINQHSNTGQVFIQCDGVPTAGNTRVESLCKFSVNAAVQNPGSYGISLHRYSSSPIGGFTCGFIPAYKQLSLFLNDDFKNVGANYVHYNWQNGTKYWLRYRTDGDAQYCKIWRDGEAEPADWSFSANYHINAAANATYGVGNYKAPSTITYYQYSIGTDGDPAPMSQYEVKQTANAEIMRQLKLSTKANASVAITKALTTAGNATIGTVPNSTPLGVYGGGWGGTNGYGSGYGHGIRPAFTVEYTKTTANAHIERVESTNIGANAHIEVVRHSKQTANATIESYYFTASKTQTANACIENKNKISQTADARVERVNQVNQPANAFVIWQKTISQSSNARISHIKHLTQSGDAYIIRVDRLDQPANARIERIETITQSANSIIRNPSPEKKPQAWTDSDDKQPTDWKNNEDKKATAWSSSSDKKPVNWMPSGDSKPTGWTESGEKKPTTWQPEYYD